MRYASHTDLPAVRTRYRIAPNVAAEMSLVLRRVPLLNTGNIRVS